jgi:methionyl-tRNA synthetase
MKPKYYLTVPIYYVNGAPHIGHAYSTFVADMLKRFRAMQGYRAVLTTGSDEHGVNVERAARKVGKEPAEFVAVMVEEWQNHWRQLGIEIDRFLRTSDARHHRKVGELFLRCKENGYVYKDKYTGQYCIHDNLYVNEAKPGDPCPECGRPTETVTEENYFFKLSAFQDRLLEHYEKHPEFVQPDHRRNEVIAFVKQGLADLSITRTSIKWGIPVPGEPEHVFYVWFDALTTYMSAVEGEDLWPADLHLIGKEILRFHAIYWPAFLMAAGWELPKRVFAHGWLLFEQDKMSKSRGNVVRATPIAEVIGVDALRYFLLREIVFGQDGSFSYDALVGRYNADLANGLGNLASRTLSMVHQYRNGALPAASAGVNSEIERSAQQAVESAITSFENFEFSKGLEAIWSLLSVVDKFIVEEAPWKLIKKQDAESQAQLDSALYTAAEVLRIATALLAPVLPESTAKIWEQLGMPEPIDKVRLDQLHWGQLQAGQRIGATTAVFPRIDAKSAIAKMRELEVQETARQAALLGKTAPAPTPKDDGKITIDDFAKVDMRVGVVLSAEPVKGADKLLHLKVDIGETEPRSIVAGIAGVYKSEGLIGRKVVIVANLQPRKLRGIPSDGMIVAASLEDGAPVLAGFLEDVPVGARLK